MADDWKGEHKISAKPKTHEERVSRTRSASSGISHKRRAAAGSNMARAGGYWAVSFAKWHKRGKIERGQI